MKTFGLQTSYTNIITTTQKRQFLLTFSRQILTILVATFAPSYIPQQTLALGQDQAQAYGQPAKNHFTIFQEYFDSFYSMSTCSYEEFYKVYAEHRKFGFAWALCMLCIGLCPEVKVGWEGGIFLLGAFNTLYLWMKMFKKISLKFEKGSLI